MLNAFKQALKGLKSNLVRTGLTTLGIVIGIATVVMVFSVGEGFKSYMVSQIEIYGSNTIFVETRVPPTTKARASGVDPNFSIESSSASQAVAVSSFKQHDIDEIKKLNNVTNAYGAIMGQKVAAYQNVNKSVIIFAADPAIFSIDKTKLVAGRPFTQSENASAAQVAILGYDLASILFGGDNPLDKIVRIGDLNFTVIGVNERKGSAGFMNYDEQVNIPLITGQKKLFGIDYLFFGVVQVADQNKSQATSEDIKAVLRKNHSIDDPAKDDFAVTTQSETLDILDTVLGAIRFLLIAIAAISLVVGGVGIMNIMYIVVTERIAEIGLKKAVGAKQSDILTEFLLEAILVTVIGGLVGIAAGSGMAYIVSQIAKANSFDWKFIVPLSGILIALTVSAAIGLIFGVFPAQRASKLDPIEALRYE
jgi:ABC-type antimicrobial peptide transport system permease subunit